MYVIFNVK